jgi:CDP-2,3-bis-(O-geranylgeranyl)-sn-glycerol synthase
LTWETLLAFIIPAYAANGAPVLFGGGKGKVDSGMVLSDRRRLFGEGKTYRGIVAALFFGTLAGALLAEVAGSLFLPGLPLTDKFLAGFLLSAGAMAGDLAGSFLKRRAGYGDGKPLEGLDQLSFLVGALLFVSPLYVPSVLAIAVLAVATYAIHKLSNWGAHQLKLKKVPW